MARILIVDDDRQICETLAEILSDEGFEVEYVLSGEEALQKIEKENYDVVITDLLMPRVDGMEILSHVKRTKPKSRVIMITAFATIENAVEAMKRGASDYIAKPFKINEIQASIRRVLEEAKFAEELLSTSGDVEAELETTLKVLANPIRRNALKVIEAEGRISFSRILSRLGVNDPTKLSFHLRQLREAQLVDQNASKEYMITPRGKRALNVLKELAASL
ncbi:response regulator [Candidatus Pyrohabitans sp.]